MVEIVLCDFICQVIKGIAASEEKKKIQEEDEALQNYEESQNIVSKQKAREKRCVGCGQWALSALSYLLFYLSFWTVKDYFSKILLQPEVWMQISFQQLHVVLKIYSRRFRTETEAVQS